MEENPYRSPETAEGSKLKQRTWRFTMLLALPPAIASACFTTCAAALGNTGITAAVIIAAFLAALLAVIVLIAAWPSRPPK